MSNKLELSAIEQTVLKNYSNLAVNNNSCCQTTTESSCCGPEAELSDDIVSFGCVTRFQDYINPQDNDVIMDLGSGMGHDLLKITKGNPTVFGYGVDFSGEMIAKAEENANRLGIENVKFIEAHLSNIPIESVSVDKIISNCVINLVENKSLAFKEMHRILKSGGKAIIADMITTSDLSKVGSIPEDMYCACVGGAVSYEQYLSALKEAGFSSIEYEKVSSGCYQYEKGPVEFDNVVFIATK